MKEDLKEGYFVGHKHCIASELKSAGINRWGNEPFEDCGSSDGAAIYEHDTDSSVTYTGFCWSCKQNFREDHIAKSSLATELGMDSLGVVTERVNFERKEKQPPLEMSQVKELIKVKGYTDQTYRGIRPETFQFFGHLAETGKDGNIKAFYYPETRDLKSVTGYKIRYLPKYFSKTGQTGLKSDLAGQIKFKSNKTHRDVILVAGEIDLCSAYQMLRDSQIKKGQEDYAPVTVLSPTTGEGSAIKQVRAQYDFLNQFENIYLGLDNDEVGQEAMRQIAEILPKDKIKICSWTHKDPNNMLVMGKERQFLSDFYNAKPLLHSGILSSANVMAYVKEELLRPRIHLPRYMSKLQENMKGGLLQGRIINIIGDTSVGKSTHANGLVYEWIFNSPVKVGVVSLEATAGVYGLDMLSMHLGKNLSWMEGKECLEYLETDEAKKGYDDLWIDEHGEERFAILDERDGDVHELERQMEALTKKHSCGIIIVDVLTDILRSLSNGEQADHLAFQKNLVKTGVTIVNILHTRKPPPTRDGIPQKATEYDTLGSSSFVQSSAINVVINRNKMAKCPIEKNTTYVDMPKCRGGDTGSAGEWYYDPETRSVYDRNKYFSDNPEKLPAGFDLTVSSFDKEYYDTDKNSSGKQEYIPPEHNF